MKITLAFANADNGDTPWLQSAYDEYTFENHGGVPDFHLEALKQLEVSDYEIREVVIEVDYDEIEALFRAPTIDAKVVS